ncbi:MAG: hypothetical protein QM662_17975, partial [Gordonia sp. (in: high G+C Gram-positive bacteria)]
MTVSAAAEYPIRSDYRHFQSYCATEPFIDSTRPGAHQHQLSNDQYLVVMAGNEAGQNNQGDNDATTAPDPAPQQPPSPPPRPHLGPPHP